MISYICMETGVITEKAYHGAESGFCIVEQYAHVYQKELPRFRDAGFNAYALPYGDRPKKRYLGIGNPASTEEDLGVSWGIDYTLLQSEIEALDIRDTFYAQAHCDLVWVKLHGAVAISPEGYEFCGYDITYPPTVEGAYSIINDCMFICKWHGCDAAGIAFLSYFEKLNENGLFDDADTALAYMNHYLSFDWTERGEYCICGIFRNKQMRGCSEADRAET